MKLIVLDDEEKVCNLICALIDWQRLGLTFAGTAADGISGLELIKSARPDFLITDIRMPGMDGLQLISEAKKLLPDLQVIIISGYSQFDYAQSAIRCGVVNYLLKPVKQQELNSTLEKMVNEYTKRQLETSRAGLLEAQVKRDAVRKQQAALLSAVRKPGTVSAEDIQLPFPVRIYIIKLDGQNPPYDMQAGSVLAESLEVFIDRTVMLPHVCVFYDFFCILATGSGCEKKEYGDQLLGWCKSQVEIFRNFTLTLAVGPSVDDMTGFYKSARLAFQGISRRLVDGTLCVYEEKESIPAADFDFSPFVKSMFACMMQDDSVKFGQLYRKFRDGIAELHLMPCQYEPLIGSFGKQLLAEARRQLEDESYDKIAGQLFLLECASSAEHLWENTETFINLVYAAVTSANREKYVRPVREAQKFVAAHYNDCQLCLNSVAAHVGLNSTYFSGLFKKNCMVGFAEYLQNIRLEKAKELLVHTKDPVKQVSFDVGYADPKHFAKVFKSITGIKPNEYRQLYE